MIFAVLRERAKGGERERLVCVSAEAAKRESGYVCVCARVEYAEHRLTDASCSSERERKEQTVG